MKRKRHNGGYRTDAGAWAAFIGFGAFGLLLCAVRIIDYLYQ